MAYNGVQAFFSGEATLEIAQVVTFMVSSTATFMITNTDIYGHKYWYIGYELVMTVTNLIA